MTDIMRFIVNQENAAADPEGNLLALDDWSTDIAKELAAQENITLSGDHIALLLKLRDFYRRHAPWKNARSVLALLEETVGGTHARKELYKLFPQGPVRQACKLAGLPVPANSADPSFGSVH